MASPSIHPSSIELFRRYFNNPVLCARFMPYPVNAVFNPAAALVGGETVLLCRVKDFRGISHLATCRSKNGLCAWQVNPEPSFFPDPAKHPEEAWGLEDPRATWLPEMGCFGIVYAAYSRQGHQICMATTPDFRTFERRGPIIPPEDKNAALFPRRFQGKWAILHRPVVTHGDANIWLSYSEDLVHWGDSTMVLECRRGPWWDAQRVGAGPPPLETPEGWLLLYYGARRTSTSSIYHAGLALLDLEEPHRVLRRGEEWILGPREMCEMLGEEPNVVLPTGWVIEGGDAIRLYYGAADTCVAAATANLGEVMDYILSCPKVA